MIDYLNNTDFFLELQTVEQMKYKHIRYGFGIHENIAVQKLFILLSSIQDKA